MRWARVGVRGGGAAAVFLCVVPFVVLHVVQLAVVCGPREGECQ